MPDLILICITILAGCCTALAMILAHVWSRVTRLADRLDELERSASQPGATPFGLGGGGRR